MTDAEVKEVLAEWLDQRVMIEGILERVNDQNRVSHFSAGV
jgi:hypothetical protein